MAELRRLRYVDLEMKAKLEQLARDWRPSTIGSGQPPIAATIFIDGVAWSSPNPFNAGEAESFNKQADKIIEKLNRE